MPQANVPGRGRSIRPCWEAAGWWHKGAGRGALPTARRPALGGRQQVRSLIMDLGDRAADFRFLVRDRAGQYNASFDAVLAGAGIEGRENLAAEPPRERLRGAVRAHRPD